MRKFVNCRHSRLSACAVLLLLLAACVGHSTQLPLSPVGRGNQPDVPAQYPGLRDLELPPRDTSAGEVHYRAGDDYSAQLGNQHVNPDSGKSSAVFSPDSTPGMNPSERCAWCIYSLVPGSNALPQLDLDWETAPPASALYIGIANWQLGRWTWQQAADPGEVTIDDLPACIDPLSGSLLLAVLVQDGPAVELNEIRLGSIDNDYLPDGPRPRLWLTPERMAGLAASMNADTPEWQRFSYDATRFLTQEHYAGPNHTMEYSLLYYKLTGDEQHAQRAMQLMDDSPLGFEVSCCPYHSQIHHIALGYDWLYEHPDMTEAKKLQYIDKLETLADMLWDAALNNGGVGNAQDTDRVTMASASLLIIGCALWGDSDRAPEFFERSWRMWTVGMGAQPESGVWREWTDASPVRRWITEFGNGPWPSGWYYATGTDFVGLKDWFETLRTACGYDPNLLEPGMDSLVAQPDHRIRLQHDTGP